MVKPRSFRQSVAIAVSILTVVALLDCGCDRRIGVGALTWFHSITPFASPNTHRRRRRCCWSATSPSQWFLRESCLEEVETLRPSRHDPHQQQQPPPPPPPILPNLKDDREQQQQEEQQPLKESATRHTKALNSNKTSSISLLDIASSITQEQCHLLGVKSICVDYGLVRTGLAVTVGYNPEPLGILTGLNNTQTCQQILRHAQIEQASRIIVGLPLHKNGTVGEQTNLTLVLAEELARLVLSELGPHVPVELWDERYTSKEAAARAHSKNPNRCLYGSLDAEAACIILEHYYHDNGQGRLPVQPKDEAIRLQCLEQYQRKQSLELENRRKASLEREDRIQRRKEAIARVERIEAELVANGEQNCDAKKKKKKKKRR